MSHLMGIRKYAREREVRADLASFTDGELIWLMLLGSPRLRRIAKAILDERSTRGAS